MIPWRKRRAMTERKSGRAISIEPWRLVTGERVIRLADTRCPRYVSSFRRREYADVELSWAARHRISSTVSIVSIGSRARARIIRWKVIESVSFSSSALSRWISLRRSMRRVSRIISSVSIARRVICRRNRIAAEKIVQLIESEIKDHASLAEWVGAICPLRNCDAVFIPTTMHAYAYDVRWSIQLMEYVTKETICKAKWARPCKVQLPDMISFEKNSHAPEIARLLILSERPRLSDSL